ncbi:hypothetical protein [Vibrio sonorensis]|uniref:hypothetical protein n=1 Tax=Vibrio sonorensis TaxID=1004316 RepID=UPI0015868911|nr:hypothetical protein [Vibrio sonorensis]
MLTALLPYYSPHKKVVQDDVEQTVNSQTKPNRDKPFPVVHVGRTGLQGRLIGVLATR